MQQGPYDLIVSRVAVVGAAVAHVVVGEGVPAQGIPAGAYGRWHDGEWSPWTLIREGARDVDVAAVGDRALVAVVAWSPAGAAAVTHHVTWRPRFFWFTASGIEEARDL